MKLGTFYNLKIRNPDGVIIREIESESHSWVMGFIDLLFFVMRATDSPSFTMTDINGLTRELDWYSNFMDRFFSMKYGGLTGPVVGTGDTAEDISDYALASLINSGSSAGELGYGTVVVFAPSTEGTYRRVLVTRTFTNQSGGSIEVKEAGLHAAGRVQIDSSHSTSTFMILRDVLVTPLTVVDANSLDVTYDIRIPCAP